VPLWYSLYITLLLKTCCYHVLLNSITISGGGGYGFLFRLEIFFRTTRELEYLFFLSREARFFSPEFNIRLYDKNCESDYFFSLDQNQNMLFSNIGNQNISLEKKHSPPHPPSPLQVKLSFPNYMSFVLYGQEYIAVHYTCTMKTSPRILR
jgi:hypothetical protein